MNISIRPAVLQNPGDADAIVALLGSYASDPATGGGVSMSGAAKQRLPRALDTVPGRVVLLAQAADESVGLAVALPSFSTFAAAPLLNLHDLVVRPDWRGRGVGWRLLDAIDAEARRTGCVGLTLEVLGANTGAQRLYRRYGFVGGQAIDPPTAPMFLKKLL